ncbi:hypothetical protein LCGC14_2737080 [marine sediment metagenome]|uniref:Uncharacterized protein n=1 Tax=marine sediment metagenome TaxID=412755 RepID=A0A0F8ZST5_9ZZZZ
MVRMTDKKTKAKKRPWFGRQAITGPCEQFAEIEPVDKWRHVVKLVQSTLLALMALCFCVGAYSFYQMLKGIVW